MLKKTLAKSLGTPELSDEAITLTLACDFDNQLQPSPPLQKHVRCYCCLLTHVAKLALEGERNVRALRLNFNLACY